MADSLINGTAIGGDTAVYRAYVLPCEYSPGHAPRPFGILTEILQRKKRGGATALLVVTREPLLTGGYSLDSTLYDGRTLAPIWSRTSSRSLSADIRFFNDSITWRVQMAGGRTQSGRARVPVGSYFAGGDRVLVRGITNPALLVGKLIRVPFVSTPGIELDAGFEGYMFVAPADSFQATGIRTKGAWAIQLGSGADNTFFLRRGTRELLGWESAAWEGTCPLRYVRTQ